MIKNTVLFLLLTVSMFTYAQKKVWLDFADEAIAYGDYYSATKYLIKALEYDTTDYSVHFQLGQTYLGYFQLQQSKSHFLKVKNSEVYPDYLEVDFYLAKIHKHQGDYAEANKLFNTFKKQYRGPDTYLKNFAINEVKQYPKVQKILTDTLEKEGDPEIKLYNLIGEVNTGSAEFSSTIYQDSILIYTALNNHEINEEGLIPEDEKVYTQMYYAVKKDSFWLKKGTLKTSFKNQNLGNAFWEKKDALLYFSVCDEGRCDIWCAKIDSLNLIDPKKLEINQEEYSTTHPMVINNGQGKKIFFSSNRPGGNGKMDLWISEYRNEMWVSPVNLGRNVNTSGNEITPYFDQSSKQLYFSSDWHYNLGGIDVFRSDYSGKFPSPPLNLGLDFNSTHNDLYFAKKDTSSGFLSSNRPEAITNNLEVCCNDLFEFKITIPPKKIDTLPESPILVVKNQIVRLKKEVPVKLFFHNDIPNPRTRDTITNLNYQTTYLAYMELLKTYKEEYPLSVPKSDRDSAELKIDSFFVNHVQKGMEDLMFFADTIYHILEKGFSIQITVKGFASPLTTNDYNINLSKRRISSFMNYLKEYPKGDFKKYLEGNAKNGAILDVKEIPNGEELSNPYVSDDYYDVRNSIYNPKAAYERRVEVQDLKLLDDIEKMPVVNIQGENDIFLDLGVQDSLSFEIDLLLQNQMEYPLIINELGTSCGCTTVQNKGFDLEPLSQRKLNIQISKEYPGKYQSQLLLSTTKEVYRITLKFEVKE